MNRIILVSLPMLALLGCGGSKKEKSVATETTVATNVTHPDADSKNDMPSVTASPKNTGTPASSSTSTDATQSADNTNQSSGKDGGNGKDGNTGKEGNTGKDGKDGKDGNTGKDGNNGKDGNTGKDGNNGKDGNTGKDGNNGKDGNTGKDGNNGKDGDNGKDDGQNPGKGNPGDCEMHVLDFDKKPDGKGFALGEKVKEQYRAWGVRIEGYRRSGDKYEESEATIFDSAAHPDQATLDKYLANSKRFGNKDGFDADLTTSKNGNVLIIAENTSGNEFITYPDDNECGGKIKLFFDKPTKVMDMDFIANKGEQSEIKLFSSQSSDADELDHQSIPVAKANEVKTLKVESNQYVAKLKVILSGSGAVDNIRICVKK